MTSTKAEPGPFDGFERAEPDEPIFTLRSADSLAADLVMLWCEQRRAAILAANFSDERRTAELIQVREAEEISFAMTEWRKGHSSVEPVVEEQPKRYSGSVMDADELAAKAKFDALKGAAQKLRNAAAEIVEAHDALGGSDVGASTLLEMTEAAETVNFLAAEVQPKRASYSHRGDHHDWIRT